jgi:hypothetical protein
MGRILGCVIWLTWSRYYIRRFCLLGLNFWLRSLAVLSCFKMWIVDNLSDSSALQPTLADILVQIVLCKRA